MSTGNQSDLSHCQHFKTGEIMVISNNMTEELIEKSDKNTTRKIHRAFSMPRNPFRWSRKFKTNKDECTIVEHPNGKIHEKQSHDQITPSSVINNRNIQQQSDSEGSLQQQNHRQNNQVQYQHEQQQQQQQQQQNYQQTNNITSNRVLRRSSFRKFLSRIAQHVSSVSFGAKHSSTSNGPDRVPPLGGYQWPPDHTPGVTGLKNHGNTCFMNAVLQCLSHTDILAEYFVLDQYKADLKRRNKLNSRKFGTKGELTEQLANVLKALWTCKNETDHSTSFKAVVDRYGTQFRSSTQHDAQEFLFWLLDKVHEDLNTATKRRYKTIKNNYGRPDEVIAAETLANHIRCNNSFVQAVFQAQFRSSLTCPRCEKQSNTFDPFHCISVQLPQLSHQTIFVTVLYVTQHPKQVKLGLSVPSGSPIVALKEQLHADTGISVNRMVLVDINETGFCRVFCDSQPISTLDNIDSLYCIEIPDLPEEQSASELLVLIANVKRDETTSSISRFGTPFCMKVNRDCTYVELQKKVLKEMSAILRPEVFGYATPTAEMFQLRLQDPSADPDTYLEQVEHPLLTEMIDMALSVLSTDAGPAHVKLLLEWNNPEKFFADLSDPIVEHESVSQLKETNTEHTTLTLEQCLEHYTKAETLSTEDAWRCPNCQQYLPVVKTLGLWSLPDILVIHFKRFRQQHEKGPDSAKLTTMVKFPLNSFDMSPHLARASISPGNTLNNDEQNRNIGSPWRKSRDHYRSKEKELKDNRYDLYSVCYHQGDTLETGHYTAACKNPYDHQWYKFDDQRVTQVPIDDVQEQIINNEAYILFYQRRKIDTTECSGTSSTSGDHWVSRITAPVIQVGVGGSSCSSTAFAATNTPDKLIEHAEQECKIIDSKDIQVETLNSIEPTSTLKMPKDATVVIEKTEENDLVDVETLDFVDDEHILEIKETTDTVNKTIVPASSISLSVSPIKSEVQKPKLDIIQDEIVENKNIIIEQKSINNIDKTKLVVQQETTKENYPAEASSGATPKEEFLPQPLWPIEHQKSSGSEQRNALNFQGAFCTSLRGTGSESSSNCSNLRHSFSTNSNYKFKECEALSMLRNAAGSSCSKDTLLYIDQQSHSLIDDDDSFLGSRSLWISPVTPHKLITVSPKN